MNGNGYEGVRNGCPADGAGTLPRIVFDDSVDSVEVVCPVGRGLLNDASNVGDRPDGVSSLMGETLRAPSVTGLVPVVEALIRARCWFCSILA